MCKFLAYHRPTGLQACNVLHLLAGSSCMWVMPCPASLHPVKDFSMLLPSHHLGPVGGEGHASEEVSCAGQAVEIMAARRYSEEECRSLVAQMQVCHLGLRAVLYGL